MNKKNIKSNLPVENITPSINPNKNIAITSLQLVVAMIKVCMPLFKPNRSSLSFNKIVTTTFGETAVTTSLKNKNKTRFIKKKKNIIMSV